MVHEGRLEKAARCVQLAWKKLVALLGSASIQDSVLTLIWVGCIDTPNSKLSASLSHNKSNLNLFYLFIYIFIYYITIYYHFNPSTMPFQPSQVRVPAARNHCSRVSAIPHLVAPGRSQGKWRWQWWRKRWTDLGYWIDLFVTLQSSVMRLCLKIFETFEIVVGLV
jgi:hypothetical protein